MSPARDGAWRRVRLAHARLYLCTPLRPDLEPFLESVLQAGVDVVQMRDKAADGTRARTAAAAFRRAADRHGALFIVNDDPELSAEVDADGVHVGQTDVHPDDARAVVGPERLVGRSTHAVEEIDRALREDCDYLGVGPVHATPTKQGRAPVGLAPVRHAASLSDRPFFVTGGMDLARAPAVLAAGAWGLVVVRAITDADDPAAAAGELARLVHAP